MIYRGVGEALMSLIKFGGILLVIFVPLGAWKAIELIGMLF